MKEKNVKTNQGNLEIWEHDSGEQKPGEAQKYASRIFSKEKRRHVFKIHDSATMLQAYITGLNLSEPVK